MQTCFCRKGSNSLTNYTLEPAGERRTNFLYEAVLLSCLTQGLQIDPVWHKQWHKQLTSCPRSQVLRLIISFACLTEHSSHCIPSSLNTSLHMPTLTARRTTTKTRDKKDMERLYNTQPGTELVVGAHAPVWRISCRQATCRSGCTEASSISACSLQYAHSLHRPNCQSCESV